MKKKKKEREHSQKDFNKNRIENRELDKSMRKDGLKEEHHGRKYSNKKGVLQVSNDELRHSTDLQLQLYFSGNLQAMEKAFEDGICFSQKVQHQIVLDGNLDVLQLFVQYWEFMPSERLFLIWSKNVEMVGAYLDYRSLGQQSENLAKDASYPKDFIIRYAWTFNDKAKAILRSLRKIDV